MLTLLRKYQRQYHKHPIYTTAAFLEVPWVLRVEDESRVGFSPIFRVWLPWWAPTSAIERTQENIRARIPWMLHVEFSYGWF